MKDMLFTGQKKTREKTLNTNQNKEQKKKKRKENYVTMSSIISHSVHIIQLVQNVVQYQNIGIQTHRISIFGSC